jgi:hypothetical protein
MTSTEVSAAPKAQSTLLGIAFAMFCVGAVVYLFDRSGADIYFIPEWWRFADGTPDLFGALGSSFPSFAHTFCFSIVFCVLLAPWRIAPGSVCIGWSLAEAALEIAQVEAVAGRVLSLLPAWIADWPILGNVPIYFSSGHFDPLDLLNVFLGGAAAWLIVELTNRYGVVQRCLREKP